MDSDTILKTLQEKDIKILLPDNMPQNDTGDCSVVCIALSLGITWEEAYKLMSKIGLSEKRMMNDFEVIKSILSFNHYKFKPGYEINKTLLEYIEEDSNDNNSYVIGIKGHILFMKDKTIHDKSIFRFYKNFISGNNEDDYNLSTSILFRIMNKHVSYVFIKEEE